MSGVLIPIIKRQRFDFSFLASGSKTLNLQRAVNVIPFGSCRLLVRVHEIALGGSGQTIAVKAYTTDPSATDQQEFTDTTAIATVTLDVTTAAPSLVDATSTDFGPYLKIDVVGTQGSSPDDVWADISVDLLARDN